MNTYIIIGIDGGATKINTRQIVHDEITNTFNLGKHYSEKKYSETAAYLDDFEPVDIKIQLAERASGKVNPTVNEQQQATVFVEACATAIEEIVEETGYENILVGIGMPGLKTADKRGIEVIANGPRMIDFCEMLESRLGVINIKLVTPVFQLGSDADYCGIGENYAQQGTFISCKNGYYLGAGTGVADALKLNNQLIPFDTIKEWMAKTWEMKSKNGKSVERYCSANGIQHIFAELSQTTTDELNKVQIYAPQILEKAIAGNNAAMETYKQVTDHLAQLIFSRITTLACGWQNDFEFVNSARPPLSGKHDFLGQTFEKIILGQRLAELFLLESGLSVLKKPLLDKIKKLIGESPLLSEQIKNHYSNINQIITASKLRDAPALGAGIDAFFSWQKIKC